MAAAPAHLHHGTDEAVYVLEGEPIPEVGERRFKTRPGSFAFLPPAAFLIATCRKNLVRCESFGSSPRPASKATGGNAGLAAELHVEESTIKTHVARLLARLGVCDRVQAVILAYEAGIAGPRGPRGSTS